MPAVKVRVEGLNEIRAKLEKGSELYAEPVRKVFEQVTSDVEAKAKQRAPLRTGRLAGSIRSEISPRAMPLWAKVTVGGTSATSFRYPWALEAGHRRSAGQGYGRLGRKATAHAANIVFHYAGTRKRTRRWFRGAARGIRKTLTTLLAQAVKEVQAKWVR